VNEPSPEGRLVPANVLPHTQIVLVSDRGLLELKRDAGDPLIYRACVVIFWWGGGAWALGHCARPLASAVLIAIAMAAGFLFFARAASRGLLIDVVFLWLLNPRIGIPLLGWLWFGNPVRGGLTERVVFAASVIGLVFNLATLPFTGTC
jgi:hypothetical protein